MRKINTQSTSASSSVCDPIILRQTERVRLVFCPVIVDNQMNPKASVNGAFVYQRKAASGVWHPIQTTPLSSLKEGDQIKLTLHAQELHDLLQGLVPLYRYYASDGLPKGRKTLIEVEDKEAEQVIARVRDIEKLLTKDSQAVLELLAAITKAKNPAITAAKLAELAPRDVTEISALLGLASLKEAIAIWQNNKANDSENFWQTLLESRTHVLSQVFSYPVLMIGGKAYLGGKQLGGKGGKESDFVLATESTYAPLIVEIKTPQTKLLGPAYRDGVYPLSRELAGAVAQTLRYRQSLSRSFDTLTAEASQHFTLGEPKAILIAGMSEELKDKVLKENFELQRERIAGIAILTFDELFSKTSALIKLLEGVSKA